MGKFRTIADLYRHSRKYRQMHKVFLKYADMTMIPADSYIDNLLLAEKFKAVDGDVAECGVWRGGMSAGLAEILGTKRKYFLFDSFEGLPIVKEIDGHEAKAWQDNTTSPYYYDNCKAEIGFAVKCMDKTGASYECIHGWFESTLPVFNKTKKLAVLRLDADWYDSTMQCLTNLYPLVVENGLILIDDYYMWAGCSRAVHDYLSSIKSTSLIRSSTNGVAYIIKQESRG